MSTVFFLAYTLSVGFWGRLILKACSVRCNLAYGSPLPLVASLGTLALALRHLSLFCRDFEAIYAAFFLAGACGSLAEGLFRVLGRRGRRGGPESRRDLTGAEGGSEHYGDGPWALASSLALFFGFALYFRLSGPSGMPGPWLSTGMDHYAWVMQADWWRGMVDPARFLIADPEAWFLDSFGQGVHLGLFSAARGGYTLEAAPLYIALLAAWTGAALAALMRGLTRLPRPLCLLAAAGVVAGVFYRFHYMMGGFAHLNALFGAAAGLCALLSPGRESKARARLAAVFFPVLFLFLGYQAGFPVFMALFAGTLFVGILLAGPAGTAAAGPGEPAAAWPPGRGGAGFPAAGAGSRGLAEGSARRVSGLLGRAPAALRGSLGPLLLSIALSAALSPQTLLWGAGRLLSAASQTAGVLPGLLRPSLFSGVPSPGFLLDGPAGTWPCWAAASLLFCALWAAARGGRGGGAWTEGEAGEAGGAAGQDPGTAGSDPRPGVPVRGPSAVAGLDALCIVFALSLAVYLCVWRFRGDSYQLWKFAGMTALPLSFLPPVLLFALLRRLAGRPARATLALGIAASALLVSAAWLAAPPRGEKGQVAWLPPFLAEVSRVRQEGEGLERAVFELATDTRNMAALSLSEEGPWREVLAVDGAYFIPSHRRYFPLIGEGTAFYTDRDYAGLFGLDMGLPPAPYRLRRWDPADFRRAGAAAWSGVFRPTGDLTRQEAAVEIAAPEALRGRDAVLEARVRIAAGSGDPRCRTVLAAAGPGGAQPPVPAPEAWLEMDIAELRVPVPREAFAGGTALARFLFPGFAVRGPGDDPRVRREAGHNAIWVRNSPVGVDPDDLLCDYVFEKVELRPSGSGGEDGGAGTAGDGAVREGP
jgi:hypothetical protein